MFFLTPWAITLQIVAKNVLILDHRLFSLKFSQLKSLHFDVAIITFYYDRQQATHQKTTTQPSPCRFNRTFSHCHRRKRLKKELIAVFKRIITAPRQMTEA